MECPICYSAVREEDEAYTSSCYHRFCFTCIVRWTEMQRSHPAHDHSQFLCPYCKQPYTYIIHDCVQQSFRVTHVDGHAHGPVRPGGQATHALGSGVQLSAEQRRRRARYVQQPLRQQQQAVQQRHLRPFQAHQHSETQQQKQPTAGCPDDSASPSFEPPLISPSSRLQEDVVAPSAHAAASGTSSSPHAADSQDGTKGAIIRSTRVSSAFTAAPARAAAERIPLRRLREASVGLWVAREVQALLLQEDVALITQHVLGVAKAATTQCAHQPNSTAYGAAGCGHGLSAEAALPTATAERTSAAASSHTAASSIHGPHRTAPSNVARTRVQPYPAKPAVLARPRMVLSGAGTRAGQPLARPGGMSAQEPVALDKAAWTDRVTAGMQAFLGGFSSAFANELWSFLASGLSVQGHDNAVFGEAGTGDLHGTGNVQGTRGLTPLGFTESPEGSRDGTDRARNEDERLSDRDGDGDGVGK